MIEFPLNLNAKLDQWGPIDAYPLYPSFWFWPIARYTAKPYGLIWPPLLGIFQKERLTFIWEKQAMRPKAFTAIQKWLLNERNFKKIRRDYVAMVKRGRGLEIKIRDVMRGSRPNEREFKQLVKSVYNQLFDLWVVSLMCELANFGAPEYLKNKLGDVLPADKLEGALEILLAPEALSFHQQEELGRLEIYVRAKSADELAKKIQGHTEQWYWVNNSYHEGQILETKDVLRELKKISRAKARQKIGQIKNYGQNNLAKKQNFCRQRRLPKNILSLARRLAFSIWWQDDRKAKVWQYGSWVTRLTDIGSKATGIAKTDLLRYSAEEWRDLFLHGRPLSKKEIQRRKKFVVFASGNRQYRLLNSKTLERRLGKVLRQMQKPRTAAQLQGIVVSKGKGQNIIGKVRIILRPKDGGKLKPGEILVAPMTSPDFVPAMRKAKAVITDIGGLMSHAAVISRELGIPAIVGTRVATKLLKDGDKVEINIHNGTVKKL